MSNQTAHYGSWYEIYIDNMKMEESIRLNLVNTLSNQKESQSQSQSQSQSEQPLQNNTVPNSKDISSNVVKTKPD
jgi:hypothetical protein